MSLELALKETTEAIRQLTATMQGSKVFAPEDPPQAKADSAKKETVPEAEDTSEDSFEQAKKRLLELSKRGCHIKAVEILNRFGAQRLGQAGHRHMRLCSGISGIL